MPSNREIEAATQALIKLAYPKGDHYERTAFDDTHVYRREAKKALEAAEQERQEWRPISEAPKDGMRILCNDAPCRDENVSIVRWCDYTREWMTVDFCQFGSGGDSVSPTYFQYLPTPPEEEPND